jgi:catechol 2,3-dioxygenase-like lactoylglutathione lyase family enzyme
MLACWVGASLVGAAAAAPPADNHVRPLWQEATSPGSHAPAALLSLAGDPTPDSFDANWVAMPLPGIAPNIGPPAMADLDGDLLLGGDLRAAGRTRVLRITRWDGTKFNAMGAPPAPITALLVSSGTCYAVTTTGSAKQIQRWNGAGWDLLGTITGSAQKVNALAVHGGQLVVGGDFTSIDGVPAVDVAAFDGSTWHALAGLPEIGPGPATTVVNSLRSFGGSLYAGVTLGVVPHVGGVYSWNGSTWSVVGSGLNDYVYSLTDDGVALYAAGMFTKSGPDSMPGVARWNGSVWQRVGVGVPASITQVAWAGGSLYINTLYRVARFNGTNWVPTNAPFNVSAQTLGEWAGRLVTLTTNPATAPGDIWNVASYDGSTWTPIHEPWSPDMIGLDRATSNATVWNDRLAVSGRFHFAGDRTQASRIDLEALFDGSSWSALGTTFGVGPDAIGLAPWGSELVAVGWTGDQYQSVAHWNGSSWQPFAPNFYAYDVVAAQEHLGSLYVGGGFNTTDASASDSVRRVARWTGSNWQALGDGLREAPGDYVYVYSLASWGGQLAAGGHFAIAGGLPATNIALWDGANWSALGAGVDGDCYALEPWNGVLVAGGEFLHAGGASAPGAAYWDGASWHPMGSEAVKVVDFAQIAGTLYAVGEFRHDDATVTSTVARWTGTSWQLLGSGASVGEPLGWVQGYHGDLYAGGAIAYAFGKVTHAITRLPAANTLGVEDGPVVTAVAFAVSPNPGRGRTTFSFALPASGRARLAVYDAAGREVALLVDGEVPAGRHEAHWNAAAAPGVYFARLDVPGGTKRIARVVRFE